MLCKQYSIEKGFLNGLDRLKRLYLSNLVIKEMNKDYFQNLLNLEEVTITYSLIESIESYSFSNQINLVCINLISNYIKLLKENAFDGLIKLNCLSLMKTTILSIDNYKILNNLNSLNELNLNCTNIIKCDQESEKAIIFQKVLNNHENKRIKNLGISLDQLEKLKPNTLSGGFDQFENLLIYRTKNDKFLTFCEDAFIGFTNLKRLNVKLDSDLTGNVSIITMSTFNGCFNLLERLKELDLSENWICNIHPYSFKSLSNLTCLKLSCNGIMSIETQTFSGLFKLKFLELQDNCIKKIEKGSFCDFKNSLSLLNLKNNSILIESMDEFRREYDLNSTLMIEI
jgi:hypothetical protein